ncbi:MAG TPA: methyltransferase domain-containing protein [Chloroflexia bacterium]|nr:methyltransferase domain-containing protein [Chloroflexia bacterium]
MKPPPRYDQIAAGYDATRNWPPAVAAAIGAGLAGLLADWAAPGQPLRVLEIGAGTGRVLAPLAAQGAWAVGLDIAPGMLHLLQAKRPAAGQGALHAVLGDAAQLPFPDAGFDAGVLVHILHLVDDWPAVLDEVGRVVRPGGGLVCGLDEQQPGDDDWIEARWAQLVADAGGALPPSQRETITAAAIAHLAARGHAIRDVVLAQWTAARTPADVLQRYRDRCLATSWDLPDAVLAPALACLTDELRAHYGSLDTPLPRARSFRVTLAT